MCGRLTRRQFVVQSGAAVLGLSALSLPALTIPRQNSGCSNAPSSPEALVADLEKLIPELMEKAVVPGAAVALVCKGEVVWSEGFGVKNADSQQPVESNTVFEAASLSKPVFAYAVLKLAERGQLKLDKPLTDHMAKPFIPIPGLMADPNIPDDPRLKLLTPRMVLSHTTGFPNWSQGKPLRFGSDPGEKFGYSGEGYVYLQRVVEHLSGQPLHEHMKRSILEPLGMHSSSYVWMDEYEGSAAVGHDRKGKPIRKRKPQQANAAASLHTTAPDFARFLAALIEPRADSAFRLNQNSLRLMLTPQIKITASLSWGLGWGLERTDQGMAFWHWGDNDVFKNFTLTSREKKLGVIILTNSTHGLKICEDIVRRSVGGEHPAFSFPMLNY